MKDKNTKLFLYGLIALCFVLIVYFGIRLLHSNNNDNDTSYQQSAAASPKRFDNETNMVNVQLPDKKEVNINSSVKRVAVSISNDALEKELLDDLISENVKEIEKQANIVLAVLSNLPEKDLHSHTKFLREIGATNNPYKIIQMVDLVTSLAERHLTWAAGKYTANPENIEKVNSIYLLIEKTLLAIENSKLFITGNTQSEIQRMRLLIRKYEIEKLGFPGIPSRDKNMAELNYTRIQELDPDTEVGKYQKIALLYKAQRPMLSDRTDVKSVITLINRPPEFNNVQDMLTVTRIRTWAFLEEANLCRKGVDELLTYKGLHYQYVIDSYEGISPTVLAYMNDYDREYFENLVSEAVSGLSEVQSRCESVGIDLERVLRRRKQVRYYRD